MPRAEDKPACVGLVDGRGYLSDRLAFCAELDRDGAWGFFKLASGVHLVVREGPESVHKLRMHPVEA